ncbi:MAG: FeoA domain-containing protein [Comamonas sp.]|uniref:FeoA family protein n=1 Tax=unclassified Comamonas TaxID=2638500 RepID=UPI000EAE0A6A|nr:FeoA domain-containing protein [Comamonas sp. lk]
MSILQSSAPGSAAPVLPLDGAAESLQTQAATLSLDTLARNVAARVVDLVSASNAEEQELMLRLMEIGFLPGERVRIVATGFPGPDPLAVRVGEATFALRRYEASKVLVAVEGKA